MALTEDRLDVSISLLNLAPLYPNAVYDMGNCFYALKVEMYAKVISATGIKV